METKNGIWKSDENRARCGIFVNKKLDQDPLTPPPLLTDPDYCIHFFFSDMYKNVKLGTIINSSDNDAQVATSCIIIFVYRL